VFSVGSISVNLWSIPIDTNQERVTGERQRLTHVEGASDEQVSLSRDGKKAAFACGGKIVVEDLATGQETQIATGDQPALSPDGSFVVYTVGEYEKAGLYRVSTIGGAPLKICQGCAYFGPKGFSSDGSKVLAQEFVEKQGLDRIELIDIGSGKVSVILSDPNHSLWHPYFSWDDQWMTFKMALDPISNDPGQHFRIYITAVKDFIPARQSRWIALTNGEYWDDKPQLSPDGNTLYFTSNRDGYNCFWAQRLNSRTKHPEGAPFAIQYLHYRQSTLSRVPGSELLFRELSVARDEIVTNLGEFHADIWMTQLSPNFSRSR